MRHPTLEAALKQLRVMRLMRADWLLRVKRLRVYPCRACGGWHRRLSYGPIELLKRRGEDAA
jgi:hypothetical protein